MSSIQKKSDIKLLVVDDREDNLFSIETILEKENYEIVKATSGRAALKILLNQHDFTLILMDVQMPDMNGFETATLIYQREKLKHIPIIFITAHNHNEDYMFEGYKMGAVDFIYKPINPELLRFKVSVFVDLYRKNHQLLQHEKKLLAVNENLAKEIEERRLNEEKIRTLNEQLIENNTHLKRTIEELDRFAYVASHDLQEPLRKIMLFSNKIETKFEGSISEEVLSYLQKINKASERMQLLVNDLLKFSRQSSETPELAKTNLSDILNDVLSDVEFDIQRKEANIIAGELPVVWAVPSQIRQVFQNLISNSLKFCKENCAPQIVIHAEKFRGLELGSDKYIPTETYYQITFSDNGIGFDQKFSEEIFVVFKRLHSYHEFEGTGIGLAICKKIIEGHNGYIVAKGGLGLGATFVITLPEGNPIAEKKSIEVQPVKNESF